jgi:transcriptional regulator with XRE-family HTH domain
MHKEALHLMLRMKAERLRFGWSQARLAAAAVVGAAEVSRIETGRLRPYPGQVEALARALYLQPEELLVEVGDNSAAA